MNRISIEIKESVLQELVIASLKDKLGDVSLTPEDVKVEVKSKQNYKSEWETASFRATVNKMI